MTHLVVLGLDNRDDAERVFDLAGDLAKQQLLQLEDAAYAYKDDKGRVRIQQSVNLAGAGAAGGALWGTSRSASSCSRAGRRCSSWPGRPLSTG
jgi:uncharacterized membrane protein